MSDAFMKRLGIIGVGLIGASFALAARERKLTAEIRGYSLTGRSSARALELGIIDKVCSDPAEMARDCDFILISTPVLTIPPILREIAAHVSETTIVTDGGSSKNFVRFVHDCFPHRNFVGGHPVAGTEKSGPDAGFSSLFDGSWCVLTPVEGTDAGKLSRVKAVWEEMGMSVVSMSPEEHDAVMADISHMPHAVAFGLVNAVRGKTCGGRPITELAGGGFRDFTRIARSDVAMWADIFVANGENVIASIDGFSRSLGELRSFIEAGDRDGIASYLQAARELLAVQSKK